MTLDKGAEQSELSRRPQQSELPEQGELSGRGEQSELPDAAARQTPGGAQLFPHHAEHRTLTVGTRRLAALFGPAAASASAALVPAGRDAATAQPPTLLLVPGYTGSKEDFAPLLDALADNGIAALAIDLPGQYESPGPDDPRDYTPAALGDVVAELVAALPEPVVLLGHSYGGLVARAAVLAGARVAGLVLLDSGPGALPAGPRMQALQLGIPVLQQQGVAGAYALRTALTERLRGQLAPPPELAEFLQRRFLASTAAGLLGMGQSLLTEPDRVDELAAVLADRQTAVAVISGEADDAWGVAQQSEMANRLGTSLVLIPGAGHSPNTEQPDRLLRAVLPLARSVSS